MRLFQGLGPKYKQLPQASPSAVTPIQRRPLFRQWILYTILISWSVILLPPGLYGLRTYFINGTQVKVKAVSCDCGDTINQAQEMGCQYDPLSVSWLPPHCRDDELTAEFNQAGPDGEWPYWADRNMTQPLTISQVGALAARPIQEAQFWTTFGWHVSHCSFYWRKEWRMRAQGLEVEHRYDRESHIKHCHMAFMSRTPLDETNTQAAVGLGGDRVGGVRTNAQKEHEIHDAHERDHHM